MDDLQDDSDDEPLSKGSHRRTKSGSGLAGRIISAPMLSVSPIAGTANQSWTEAVRYSRVDLAEVCCTADTQLAGEVQRWDRQKILALEWVRHGDTKRLRSTSRWTGEHSTKMGLAFASVRSRLSDAEPEPEDRSTATATGSKTQPRAPHSEEPIGDRDMADAAKKLSWSNSRHAAVYARTESAASSSANFMELWFPDANGN